ncbi:pyrroline-5-carboxylate reductase [Haloplanus vescus]|uniref:Pyrroline-5-carboxylate reductase n=1 Tax=Haloplanus vescus TaxID=555874 RepID=A0A1H3W601_9EURY|nr:pyrroline-5-carboxylate reductase [Haloplanus vescus]SDZ81792.1 pyrroline-5-carboxylate reductase [Haloplanus vescus]
MTDVSVIGCGHMGSALVKGLSRVDTHRVTACDRNHDTLEALDPYCAQTTTDVAEAATADVVIVAVKPNSIESVLDDLDLPASTTLVSVAAGVPRSFLQRHTDATVVRVMPNMAAETGNMAAAVAWDDPDDAVAGLLDDLGEYVVVDEDQMDVATALNGSGPAFVYYFIQSMQNAAVAEGLDPDAAETLAAQTFKGAAETVLRADEDVAELIDAVCSEGGTTIEGMEVLWDSDVESVVGETLGAAAERSRELAGDFDDE